MESLNEKIKLFLQVSVEENVSPLHGDNGDGYGQGFGCGKALGCGHPSGVCLCTDGKTCPTELGIKVLRGKPVYSIDDIPTIIENVRGNIAKGYIVKPDLSLMECYIVKVGNVFAHAKDAHAAYTEARDKAIKYGCVECVADYANYVVSKYPDVDAQIDRKEIYELHNIITGSCDLGRKEFLEAHGLTLEGTISMREFLNLVKYAYGKERIAVIAEKYGITL